MKTNVGNSQHAVTNPRWDRRDGYAVVVLIVLWALFFWRYFAPVAVDRVALPVGDFTEHFYVLRSFAYDQLRAGHFPSGAVRACSVSILSRPTPSQPCSTRQ